MSNTTPPNDETPSAKATSVEDSNPTSSGATPGMARPIPGQRFSLRQSGLHVPKPSYHRHLPSDDEVADSDVPQPESISDADGSSTGDSQAPARSGTRKAWTWAFVITAILLYVVLRMLERGY